MILKCNTIANIKHARYMASHLFKSENEVIQVLEASNDNDDRQVIEDDLVDLQLLTKMTQGNTGLFHVAIAPREHETMTPEQWVHAVESIEQEFKLEGQDRKLIYHEKKGRPHIHAFWSTVDQEKKVLIDLPFTRRRLQRVATQLEQDFGHELTRRTANENTLEITHADRMRQARTGKDPQERKQQIHQIWKQTKDGKEFTKAMREAGYEIAQGDRAAIVMIDREGEVYNLTRQLPKQIKKKHVAQRLEGIELQTVKDAQLAQDKARKRLIQAEIQHQSQDLTEDMERRERLKKRMERIERIKRKQQDRKNNRGLEPD